MKPLAKRRAIFDRRAVAERFAAIAAEERHPARQRAAILEHARTVVSAGRTEILGRLDGDQDGTAAAAGQAFLVDQLLRTLHDFARAEVYPAPNPTEGERLAIIAVGGYGRGELAPYSDIDLLFLISQKVTPRVEQLIEFILYFLWDLGFKVGHATRGISECMRRAKEDVTIRTSLLDARYIWGEQAIHREFRQTFAATFSKSAAGFIEAKLAERDNRHEKLGGSRYVLEPNLKDGKGGLRDLQTLFWIAECLHGTKDGATLVERDVLTEEEYGTLLKAHNFLWTTRYHLHTLAGRGEERLTFDVQPLLSKRMGYTDRESASGTERFMKHYFLVAKDVGDLTRIFCAAMESENKRRPRLLPSFAGLRRTLDGFALVDGRLGLSEDEIKNAPTSMLRLFHVANARQVDIHPAALRAVSRSLRLVDKAYRSDTDANRIFIDILSSRRDPESTLRQMNESGLFGRFVPDFGRVVAQMQYDMYHVYTVDEHSIRAIGILSRIEQGLLLDDHPLASEVIHQVVSREVLYVAVFLHDIAKGRPGDHSVVGAQVALDLAPRLGFSAEDTETISWLVRWHLLMSFTAFKRDLDDPKTIDDFVEAVQSPENLRLLLVLTVADIRAVGPKTWTPWKAALLRKLYHAAMDQMAGSLDVEVRSEQQVAAARQALAAQLPDWEGAELDRFVAGAGTNYWLVFDTPAQVRHARMLRELERTGAPLSVDMRVDGANAVTEVTVIAPDRPGLLPLLAGALAVCGASIEVAKVFTLANGVALDSFIVQSMGTEPFARPDRRARLVATLEHALSGVLDIEKELNRRQGDLPSRQNTFFVSPRVVIDNQASNTHTVIEVNGRDRPGFLWRVSDALARINVRVGKAKIATYGEKAVDVFYVKDGFGLKIIHAAKLRQIREALAEALRDDALDSPERVPMSGEPEASPRSAEPPLSSAAE